MRGVSFLAVTVAGLIVGGYGAWGLWRSLEAETWQSALFGAVAVTAGLGMLARQPWSRFLVYTVAAVVCVAWTYVAITKIRAGSLENYDELWLFLSKVQGVAIVVMALVCSLIANRFLRPVSRLPNKSLERTRER